jgi:RNase H-fold protein (predicted Holliday junction resolvase)
MNNSNTPTKRNTILGISPGTRTTGIAIFRQRELVEYQVKTFAGKITKKKLLHVLNSVEVIMDRYAVDSVVLKIPKGKARSKDVQYIITGIEKMAADKGLQFYRCTISDLKRVYSSDKKATRKDLAEYLMLNYPELSYIEHSGYNKHAYYGKMFEAIAAGMQININN